MSETGTVVCHHCRKAFITDWPENQIINGSLVLGVVIVKKRTACPQCHKTFVASIDPKKCEFKFAWIGIPQADPVISITANGRERAGSAGVQCEVCTERFEVARPMFNVSRGSIVDTMMATAEAVHCSTCNAAHRPLLAPETSLSYNWVEETVAPTRAPSGSLIVMPGAPLR